MCTFHVSTDIHKTLFNIDVFSVHFLVQIICNKYLITDTRHYMNSNSIMKNVCKKIALANIKREGFLIEFKIGKM